MDIQKEAEQLVEKIHLCYVKSEIIEDYLDHLTNDGDIEVHNRVTKILYPDQFL